MKILQCNDASRASRAEQRRLHLLDVARNLFSEQGFHNTGVAQIASVSGIGVGQIYRDFASKEEIVAAITEVDLAKFLEEDRLAAAVDRGDTAAVRGWIARFIEVDEPEEECRMMCEIAAEAARNARIATLHHQIDARVRATLMRALAMLAPHPGHAARRTILVDLIMTMGNGLIYRRIADPALGTADLIETMDAIIAREIDGLIAAPLPDASPACGRCGAR